MLRIKLVKSVIGNVPRNRATVRALGLTKTHQTVVHPDTPVIRGMVHHVKHLLEVEVVTDGSVKPKASARPKRAKKLLDAPAKTKTTTKKSPAAAKGASGKTNPSTPKKKPTKAPAEEPTS